jgi:hypothetical protein
VGEGCGFVEAEAGFWIGRILKCVTLNLLEEPIDHAHVVVEGMMDVVKAGSGRWR